MLAAFHAVTADASMRRQKKAQGRLSAATSRW